MSLTTRAVAVVEHSLQLVGNRLRRLCIDCVAIVDARRNKSIHERTLPLIHHQVTSGYDEVGEASISLESVGLESQVASTVKQNVKTWGLRSHIFMSESCSLSMDAVTLEILEKKRREGFVKWWGMRIERTRNE